MRCARRSSVGAHLLALDFFFETQALGIAPGPAVIDPDVTAVHPSKLFQFPFERLHTDLTFRIVFGQGNQHADASYLVALLRACCERPRCRTTCQKTKKFPVLWRKRHKRPWLRRAI
jgi:hypothetical protein